MVIADGRRPGVLAAVLRGEPVGTYFAPRTDRLAARKRWIAFAIPAQGALQVDAGARRALVERGKSLLPSGVVKVEGEFAAGDAVGLLDPDGREFARGLVNYDAREVDTPARRQDRRHRAPPGLPGPRRSHPPRQPGHPLRGSGFDFYTIGVSQMSRSPSLTPPV